MQQKLYLFNYMYLEEISNIVRDKLDKRVVILDEFSLEPS